MKLLLSIFSGGLFLLDVFLLGLAYFMYVQAKQEAKTTQRPWFRTNMFVIGALCLLGWVATIIWRVADL